MFVSVTLGLGQDTSHSLTSGHFRCLSTCHRLSGCLNAIRALLNPRPPIQLHDPSHVFASIRGPSLLSRRAGKLVGTFTHDMTAMLRACMQVR